MIRWLARSLDDVPADDAWMSPSERATLAGMHVQKRRADYRLGRFTAHAALEAFTGRSGWSVRARDDGSPEAEGAEVALSISHSAGRAVAAVGPAHVALGCDLEHVEPRSEALVLEFFDDEERARLPADETRDRFVTLLWSAKESALKAMRVGLRADPRAVHVDWDDGLRVRIDGRVFRGEYRVDGGWVMTVVADPFDALLEL